MPAALVIPNHPEDQQSGSLAEQHPHPVWGGEIARRECRIDTAADGRDAHHHRQDPRQHISAVVDAADDAGVSKRRTGNARPALQQRYVAGSSGIQR